MKNVRWIFLISLISCQNIQNSKYENKLERCYQYEMQIRLVEDEPFYKDTIFHLRNYNSQDSLRKIVCNGNPVDKELESIIWKSKYIKSYTRYLEKFNWNAIINYSQRRDGKTVVNFFILQKDSMKMEENITLLVDSNEIIGIKLFHWLDDFISIEKYEKNEVFYGTDPYEMDSIHEYKE